MAQNFTETLIEENPENERKACNVRENFASLGQGLGGLGGAAGAVYGAYAVVFTAMGPSIEAGIVGLVVLGFGLSAAKWIAAPIGRSVGDKIGQGLEAIGECVSPSLSR
ncbi:MAG: hypothetical protein QM752_06265 [Gammaproteobacteria bacterium]